MYKLIRGGTRACSLDGKKRFPDMRICARYNYDTDAHDRRFTSPDCQPYRTKRRYIFPSTILWVILIIARKRDLDVSSHARVACFRVLNYTAVKL